MNILFENLDVYWGKRKMLKNVTLEAQHGKVTGIIGANGSGKSTLIKTLVGIASYKSGEVYIDGANIKAMGDKKRSEKVGYVGQDTPCVFDFTVSEVIDMALPMKRKKDREQAIKSTLAELDLIELEYRSILSLSGGERKLVFLARALAQGVDTIILDEPTNHLDIQHQLFLMEYLKKSGKTILIVIHDLHLAAKYCDVLYLLKNGSVLASGCPRDVLCKENLEEGFQVTGMVEFQVGGPQVQLELMKI